MPLISSAGIMVAMNINPEIISLIDEIKNDKTHGASQLARQAASVLKVAAERSQTKSTDEFWQEQKEIGQRLMSVRPAMAPVFNIVARLLDAMSGKVVEMELDSVRHFAISKVDEIVGDSLQAIAQIAQYGSELIADGDKIMTHSYSSTVVAMLKAAFAEHGNVEVITTRSGPGGSGEVTARELGLYGMPVTFIDDTAMGLYMSMVNEVDLEEKEPSEVIEPGRLPPEVRVKNPHFDITPLELITGVVTENGLLTPEEVISYMPKQSVSDS